MENDNNCVRNYFYYLYTFTLCDTRKIRKKSPLKKVLKTTQKAEKYIYWVSVCKCILDRKSEKLLKYVICRQESKFYDPNKKKSYKNQPVLSKVI